MCGIAALVGLGAPVDAAALAAMAAAVRHRGPDDAGVTLFAGDDWSPRGVRGANHDASQVTGEVGLAHRRLSIVDLSAAGHQPMASDDGRYWITYNGEIYNYVELRADLAALGWTFRTATDTEVLLAAFAQWGEACLDRCNGMFALLIVDRVARRVFAARDRFGVKPLYWWRSPRGVLAFASEIKQFTVLPGWSARLNGPRARDFLAWGMLDHTAETLFASVRQLRGGECMSIDAARADVQPTPRRWYRLAPASASRSFADAAREFRTLLEDSCRLRLRADVPVGSCLSGGLDSSSIVCVTSRALAAHGASGLQRTFSARSADPRYDEGAFIAAVTAAVGAEHREVTPELDRLPDLLAAIAWHQDEPFGSTSIYAQWCVFALAAANGVKVMLDGQGADELLAGYHGFLGARFASLARKGHWLALARDMSETRARLGYGPYRLAQYLAGALLPGALAARLRRLAGMSSGLNEAWFDGRRLAAGGDEAPIDLADRATSIAAMSRAQLLDAGLPMLLHWEDRNSMAHGVEARLPFLDYRIVEFGLGLPDDVKLAGGVTKRVLREAMAGLLPESIRDRRDKLGFVTPEEPWLKGTGRTAMRALVARAIERAQGALTPAALDMFDAVADGRRPFGFLPWRIASFGAWLERFAVDVA